MSYIFYSIKYLELKKYIIIKSILYNTIIIIHLLKNNNTILIYDSTNGIRLYLPYIYYIHYKYNLILFLELDSTSTRSHQQV